MKKILHTIYSGVGTSVDVSNMTLAIGPWISYSCGCSCPHLAYLIEKSTRGILDLSMEKLRIELDF